MIEIFDIIKAIFIKLKEYLLHHFNGPDGALQALALAGFIVILLLFIIARRQGLATKSSKAVKEPVVLSELAAMAEELEDGKPDALETVATRRDQQNRKDQENSVSNVDGFVFHRRKAKKTSVSAKIEDEDTEIALAAIEQEMLATRQLFLDGVISREVYVEETRNLYGKAQQKI